MNNQIARKLYKLRKANNLTQKEIAAAIGIGRPCYSSYEEGRASIPINTLLRISQYYEIPLDYFANVLSIPIAKYNIGFSFTQPIRICNQNPGETK